MFYGFNPATVGFTSAFAIPNTTVATAPGGFGAPIAKAVPWGAFGVPVTKAAGAVPWAAGCW